MFIIGLREAHHLGDEELVRYLGSAPGCSRDAVTAALKLDLRASGSI